MEGLALLGLMGQAQELAALRARMSSLEGAAGAAQDLAGKAWQRADRATVLSPTALGAGKVGGLGGTFVESLTLDELGRVVGITTATPSGGPSLPLTVANGGTGLTSYAAGDLLYASGTTTIDKLAAVATGQVLTSGTSPAWSATPTVTTLTGSTSLLTPLLDRASAGTLTIGPTATTVAIKSTNIRLQSAAGGDGLWIIGSTSVTCYAGTFDTPASAITFNWGNSTGPFTLSQGNVTWTGAVNSTLSLIASGGSGTALIQTQGSGAHLSLKTTGTSAYVLLDGTTGIVVRRNAANFCDFGNTSSTALTLAAGISLSGAAGGGGLALGSLTGNWDLPQGNGSWAGAFNKYLSLSTTGASGTIYLGADAPITISSGNEIRLQSSGSNRLYINSGVVLAAGISLSGAAGAGGLSCGSMTGPATMPQGDFSWSGGSGKTFVISASGSASSISLSTPNVDTNPITLNSGNRLLLRINNSTVFEAVASAIGFYGVTPVSRQSTTGTTAGFTAGAGSAVLADSTFTGNTGSTAYTIGDVVKALKNYGLLSA